MSGEQEESRWRRTPGWFKLLLILSLSANVAILGVVGGSAMHVLGHRGHPPGPPNEPGLDRSQSRLLRMVPEARRDVARTIILSREDEYREAREKLLEAQEALVAAIRHEPFDPHRLGAALAERREASIRAWGIGYQQIAEIALKLSDAERAEMAERLEERSRRWAQRMQRKER